MVNYSRSNHSTPDNLAAKLAVLGGGLATLGDAIATLGAIIELEELNNNSNDQPQTQQNNNQIIQMQKQIDDLTNTVKKLESNMNRRF